MVRRPLERLPKAHLHLHLFGSARPETIEEFAGRHGPGWRPGEFHDLLGFMGEFSRAEALIETPEDLERICRELVADEAAAGAVYIEPSFVPHDMARRFGLTPQELFLRMHRAFQEAGAEHGVTVRYMISPNRGRAYDYLMETAAFAAAMKPYGVVAFGWGGNELWGHARMQAPAAIARRAGLRLVPHAGEIGGPDSVRDALQRFPLAPPDRIAHGVQAAADPRLLTELANRGITCDVCISSNVRLGVVESAADHPLAEMVEMGVPVSLNSDDQLFFGSSIADEYRLARDALHLSDAQLAHIARCSILASSLPRHLRERALADIARWEATPPPPSFPERSLA